MKKGIPKEKLLVAYNALDTDKQISIRDRLTQSDVDAHKAAMGLSGRMTVVFLGRLIKEKKPLVFVKAVERAAETEPKILGLVIGEGPERPSLQQYVGERSLSKHFKFIGAVYDEEKMAKLLIPSVAVVIPAFGGLAIQHAAVYGVPVVLGNLPHSHGPEQEIVEEGRTGLWCPDEDVEAFAAAMIRLSRDETLRTALSENLRHIIHTKYNVQRMAQGFIDAVNYCLGSEIGKRGS